MNAGVGLQIRQGIGAKSGQIGIDRRRCLKKTFHQRRFRPVRVLGGGQRADGGRINGQRPHDAPPAPGKHAAPVFETGAHQLPGGDAGDGFVPVLHFDGVQIDFNHRPIGVLTGHLNPVVHAQHVVAGQLHARHKRQNRVFEHQHQHRRHGPQAREQQQGRAVQHRGHDQQQGHNAHGQLAQLHIAFDGARLRGTRAVVVVVRVVQGIEQRHHRPRQVVGGKGCGQVVQQVGQRGLQVRHAIHRLLHDDGGHHLGHTAQHRIVQRNVPPAAAPLLTPTAHHLQ